MSGYDPTAYHRRAVAAAHADQYERYGNNVWDRNSTRHDEWLAVFDKTLIEEQRKFAKEASQ